MKKKRKQIRVIDSIDFGIFGGWIMVFAGFSFNEALDRMKKQKTPKEWVDAFESKGREYIDSTTWCAFKQVYENEKTKETRSYYFIYLKDPFDFSDDSFCKLAHEVLHICQFYLPYVLVRNTEIEAEAYLHTHIMSKCLSIFRGDKKIVNLYNH